MSNVGNLDRIVRALVGLVLTLIPFVAGWPIAAIVISAIVGVVLIATAAVGFCPIYAALHLSSKRGPLTKA
jgi:hypothetical protein